MKSFYGKKDYWRDHLKKEIIFQETNLKHKKIMHLTNFIFTRTFFLIASYQILKNDVILINHESFFQEKDFPQLNRFQFSEMNKLSPNSAICLLEFVLKNWFLMVSAINEFISKNGNGKVVKIIFPEKMIRDLIESHNFVKFGMKR